jgi:hypothetical protein
MAEAATVSGPGEAEFGKRERFLAGRRRRRRGNDQLVRFCDEW